MQVIGEGTGEVLLLGLSQSREKRGWRQNLMEEHGLGHEEPKNKKQKDEEDEWRKNKAWDPMRRKKGLGGTVCFFLRTWLLHSLRGFDILCCLC